MPEGSLTWVMEGDVDSVLRATDGACIEAVAGLGGLAPIAFLAFDCAARLHVLGDSGVAEEMARLSARCGDSPLAGFYTFAEVARVRGVNGFHHQTLVMLAIA